MPQSSCDRSRSDRRIRCPTSESLGLSAEVLTRDDLQVYDASARRVASTDLPSARAGLSLGPVLARGGDYFGRSVNLASRLVAVAPPDTVLVDTPFAEAIAGNSALAIEPLGDKSLKGLGMVHA